MSKMDYLVAKTKGWPCEDPRQSSWGDDLKENVYYVENSKRKNAFYKALLSEEDNADRKQRMEAAYQAAKELVNKSGYKVLA